MTTATTTAALYLVTTPSGSVRYIRLTDENRARLLALGFRVALVGF